MQKIIVTGGGTAGHITPILALLPYLKREFDEIHYFGSETGMEKKLVEKYDYVIYHSVPCIKFVRGLSAKNLKIPFVLFKGVKESKKLLKAIKPDVIFSKGGYVSLPVCIAAKGIPVILHESDCTMGLANRLVAKKSAAICTAFPDTAQKYKNAVVTGIPLRRELFLPKAIGLELNPHLPTVLVMGGSLGARAINECVEKAAELILNHYNLIHITGRGNSSAISSLRDKGAYFQLEYTENIQDYLNLADIVVSRGGAGTLFELMALKKPALVIPLPKGRSRGDQYANAKYFADKGCCYLLEQERLSPLTLIENLNRLYEDKTMLYRLGNKRYPDGIAEVLKIIKQFSEENKQCKK